MDQKPLNKKSKRRTTLTLPSDLLGQAERIAQLRHVTSSTVIAEALSEGLRQHIARERCDDVLKNYQKAFAGFSDDELLILDGVMLEPVESDD